MEGKKYIFFIATFIVALAVSSYGISSEHNYNNNINRYARAAENKSHNLIVGKREFGDRLLLNEKVEIKYKFLSKVTFEKTFNVTGFVITEVAAYDRKANGKGANVALTAGGPKADSVRLRFESQRGHGIHFVVFIYGHYNRHY